MARKQNDTDPNKAATFHAALWLLFSSLKEVIYQANGRFSI